MKRIRIISLLILLFMTVALVSVDIPTLEAEPVTTTTVPTEITTTIPTTVPTETEVPEDEFTKQFSWLFTILGISVPAGVGSTIWLALKAIKQLRKNQNEVARNTEETKSAKQETEKKTKEYVNLTNAVNQVYTLAPMLAYIGQALDTIVTNSQNPGIAAAAPDMRIKYQKALGAITAAPKEFQGIVTGMVEEALVEAEKVLEPIKTKADIAKAHIERIKQNLGA